MIKINKIIETVHNFVRRTGFDITRYPSPTFESSRNQLLIYHDINVVLDVGANIGQYGERLRNAGYNKRIISFEPMSNEFKVLKEKCSADSLWECYQIGLGEEYAIMEINISQNSISSSLLPMLHRHETAAPKSVFINKENVQIKRLNDVVPRIVDFNSSKILLKMDAQGYELSILKGADDILSKVDMIESELSFVPLYEGQPLITDMVNYLDRKDFTLVYVNNGFTHETGHVLQADGLFVRSSVYPLF